MDTSDRRVFERIYGRARRPEDLPWYRTEPPAMLVAALDARGTPGTAADVGCGAGTHSIYMARRGFRVTAVDFMPQATAMLASEAAAAGLDITAITADVLTWQPPRSFDVVLDAGCLHSLGIDRHAAYKSRLLQWLRPGGDFVLIHCGRRGWWDWWPVGPDRVSHDAIARLFAPELTLQAYDSELLRRLPLMMGRNALIGRYWLHRAA